MDVDRWNDAAVCCWYWRFCDEKSEVSGESGITVSTLVRWMGVSAVSNVHRLNCTYNVILRRLHVTVAAGLSVC